MMCPFALEALYRASSYYNVFYDFPPLMDGKLTGVRDLPALQCFGIFNNNLHKGMLKYSLDGWQNF